MAETTCTVPGCGRARRYRLYCDMHQKRFVKRGDPGGAESETSALYGVSVEERFWAKVNKTETCWQWIGALSYGYGRFGVTHGHLVQAHRFAYELLVGPIPEGLQLDHLCRNPACVNPAHLEPVTGQVNVLRGHTIVAAQAARTHCPQGHAYDEENTRVDARGCRHCRRCQREAKRAKRATS